MPPADQKISGLPEATTLSPTDLLYVLTGDGDRKVQAGNILGTPGPPGPQGPAGSAAGRIFYYALSDSSDIVGYKTMLESPSAAAEQTLTVACTGVNVDFLLEEFATDPGVPGVTDFPGGTAYRRFYVHLNSGTARLHLQVFKRTAVGVETLVRDEFSPQFLNQTVGLVEWLATSPSGGAMDVTDRIVNKVYAQRVTGGGGTVQVTLHTEGSVNASQIQTTISTGDVKGPASAVNNSVAVFNGTTGRIIKDSIATIDGSGLNVAGSITAAGPVTVNTNESFYGAAPGHVRWHLRETSAPTNFQTWIIMNHQQALFLCPCRDDGFTTNDGGANWDKALTVYRNGDVKVGGNLTGAANLARVNVNNNFTTHQTISGNLVAGDIINPALYIWGGDNPANPGRAWVRGNGGHVVINSGPGYGLYFNLDSGQHTYAYGAGFTVQSPLSVVSVSNNTGLAHGTYAVPVGWETNIGGLTSYEAQYMRVGNTITVSGKLDVYANAVGWTIFHLGVPVASTFAANHYLAGTIFFIAGTGISGSFEALGGIARCFYYAPFAGWVTGFYTYTYRVA